MRRTMTAVLLAAMAMGTVSAWAGVPAESRAAEAPIRDRIENLALMDPGAVISNGPVRHHLPNTLFEYIDGKADGYLDYAFEELTGIDYRRKAGGEIAVDVYRHATPEDAYGIFSSERPMDAVDAGVGAVGYTEPGHFNFVKGVYYVKIAGRDLGEDEADVLTLAATRMAGALAGDETLPPTVDCFPGEGLVPNSVRYVSQGFLGHSFLHRAFEAEYEGEDGTYRAFILEGADEADRDAMLAAYLDLVRRKGGEEAVEDGVHRFYDPYRTFEGVINVKPAGARLLGVFHDDPSVADGRLEAMETCPAGEPN